MKTFSFTAACAAFAQVLDGVINGEEAVITRADHEPVVIVPLSEYESLRETAYLLSSPTNARRLLDAVERLESGRSEAGVAAHDLIES